MGFSFASNNPALNAAEKGDYDAHEAFQAQAQGAPRVATITGVVHKTTVLSAVAVVAGAGAYVYLPAGGSLVTISCIASFVICLGIGWVLMGKPQLSAVLAPIYAAVEGVFLGLLTRNLDAFLFSRVGVPADGVVGAVYQQGLALPAFIITMSCVSAVLTLYYFRILKPTRKFVAIVSTLVMAVMFTYFVSFMLSMFANFQMPYLSLGSAMQGGQAGMIGLGLNAVILLLASAYLVIDFGRVEKIVANRSPVYMEWYCAFGLIVTLTWIYYEAVKMAFRLAMLFNSRD